MTQLEEDVRDMEMEVETPSPVDDSCFAVDIPECPVYIDVKAVGKSSVEGLSTEEVIVSVGSTDDCAYVYSCQFAGSLLQHAEQLCTIKGHSDSVSIVKVLPSGQMNARCLIVTAGLDSKLNVWSVPSAQDDASLLASFDIQEEPLDVCVVDEKSGTFCVLDGAGCVAVYSVSQGGAGVDQLYSQCLASAWSLSEEINLGGSIGVLEVSGPGNGQKVFAVGYCNAIEMFSLDTATLAVQNVGSYDLHTSSSKMASVNQLKLGRLPDGLICAFVASDHGLFTLAWSGTGVGSSGVSKKSGSSKSGSMKVYNHVPSISAECIDVLRSPTGQTLALLVGCMDGNLMCLRASNASDVVWSRSVVPERIDADLESAVTNVRVISSTPGISSSSGTSTVHYTVGGDGAIGVADAMTGEALAPLCAHEGHIHHLASCAVGSASNAFNVIATVSEDLSCRLFVSSHSS